MSILAGWLLTLPALAQVEPLQLANVKNGLKYAYYETGTINNVPDFNTMTPKATGETTNFNVSVRQRDSRFGLRFEGYLKINKDGSYKFFTRHNDASLLYIGGQLVVNNDGLKGTTERSGDITLKAGYYTIRMDYIDGCCAPSPIEVSYQLNNSTELPKQYVPAGALFLAQFTNPVTATTVPGVNYLYYEGQWSSLPDFAAILPKKKGDLTNFSLSPKDGNTNFAFQYKGYLSVATDGLYTFYTTSKDGSKLYIGDYEVVNNDGLHNVRERSGSILLKAGLHPIRLAFFQQAGTPYLEVTYAGPSIARQSIPDAALTRVPFATEAPAAPANVQATATAGSISLTWDALSGAGIRYGVFDGTGTLLAVVNGTSYTASGLTAGITYTFGVSAVDADGNQSAKTSVTASTTGDTEAPSVPQNLAASTFSNEITLIWRKSTDNGTLAGYRVYDSNDVLLKSVTDTTAKITGLQTYTSYTFKVSAFDVAGNESAKASVTYSTAFATGPQGGLNGWTQTFGDDFNGTALDQTKWVTAFPWKASDGGSTNGGTAEIGWCLPKNVIVKDGKLTLRSIREKYTAPDGKTYDWTSGIITNGRDVFDINVPNKYSHKYGYMEIRAKMPKGQGAYTAFWFTADDLTWPPELDVFEYEGTYPKRVHQTIHYLDNTKPSGRDYSSREHDMPTPLHDDYHTYGMLWLPDQVVWYVDGIETRRETNPLLVPKAKKMVFELQCSVWGPSGWGLGPSNDRTLTPDTLLFDVDYVRVWQKNEDVLPANLLEPVVAANTTSGLDYAYYEGNWTVLPNFSSLTPAKTGTVATLTTAEKSRDDNFAFKYTGFFQADKDGVYKFYLNSKDGSQLSIGNTLVVNNDGPQDTPIEGSGSIGLKKGLHPVTITYFNREGDETLELGYELLGSDGFAKTAVPAAKLQRFSYRDPENPEGTLAGIRYKYYDGYFENVPNFSTLTLGLKGDYPNIPANPKPNASDEDFYAVKFEGFIKIDTDGIYTFYTNSDDGSKLWIGDALVVNNDGRHGTSIQKSGQIALKKGLHALTVGYMEFNFGQELYVRYEGPGIAKQLVPSTALFREPFETTPPTTPGNLQVTELTANKVGLKWEASTDNIAVTGYRVYRGTTLVTTTKNLTAAVGSLQPVTEYILKVVAVDEVGNESAPATVTVTTPDYPLTNYISLNSAPVIDGTPDNIWTNQMYRPITNVTSGTPKAASDISGQFKTMWDSKNFYVLVDVKDDTLRTQLSPRADFWKDDGIEVYIDVNNDKATTYGTNDYQYVFRYSDSLAMEMKSNKVSGVQFAQRNVPGGYQIEIKFPLTTLGAIVGNGSVMGLDVQLSDGDKGIRDTKLAWTATQDNAFNNPSVFGTVRFRQDDTAPPAPVNLNATVTATTASLTWQAPADSTVTSYKVYQGNTYLATVTGTSYWISGLTQLTTYTFRVTALDEADNASEAATITVTTKDGQAPTTPTNLTAVTTTNTAALTWSRSTDNAGVKGYKVYQENTLLATVTDTAYTVTGLTALTTYNFKVSAVDSTGNESGFATVSATTLMPLRSPENPANARQDVLYYVYNGRWTSLPNFDRLRTGRAERINKFGIPRYQQGRNDFALKFVGYIEVPADGMYTFYTNSDEGSKLYIGNQEVVNNDGLHTATEKSGQIGLKAGKHAITVTYFEARGSEVLTVSYAGPGITKREIPASVLYHVNPNSYARVSYDNVESTTVELFPNPSDGKFTIRYHSPAPEKVKVIVQDGMGRAVLSKQAAVEAGENLIEVNGSTLNSGLYHVVVGQGVQQKVEKLIIKR